MILLVDAGNTRIKWALAHREAPPGTWIMQGAALHDGLDALAETWAASGATQALVSNVAGPALRDRLAAALPSSVALEWFASTPERAGLRNGYREPGKLGCDRFAAAIGARALAPGRDLVVATCGTATTVDAVRADGLFIGGMILPGLALMASSLARNTAQLPQVAPGVQPPLFGTDTEEAILAGCLSAQAGAIARACAGFAGFAPAVCIVSGGAAPWIAPALKPGHVLVDNIVLVGLHAAAAASIGEAPC